VTHLPAVSGLNRGISNDSSQKADVIRHSLMMKTDSYPTAEIKDIAAFEARYRYDATYLTEMLSSSPEAYRVFSGFLPMAQFRLAAAPEVYFTAKVTAFREVDCGPCLQLAIRMAREAGVSKTLIHNLLQPESTLSPVLASVRSFSRAVLAGAPECNELRAKLLKELGAAAMIEIGLAIASAQGFPVLKRAMGHYRSCSATPLEV
jgi:hypothetical protein